MPQGPIAVKNVSNAKTQFNIAAPTVVKVGAGHVVKIGIVAPATAATFGVYDAATTGAAATANAFVQAIAAWPAGGTVIALDAGFTNGLVINPGTGGVVSVQFI